MDQIEKVKGKIDAIKKQKEELIEELRGEIWPIFRHIFENSEGQIKQLSWPQYTDHWNDGEECTFSVHTDIDYNILINGESVEQNISRQGICRQSLDTKSRLQFITKGINRGIR